MSDSIVIHGFETSNNMKVRITLGYKGIPYEFRTIDPAERTALIQLSGQYLTPVMEHGGTVLFDSAAIMRYIEATFPDTPRLYGHDRDEQWQIEDWELFARAILAQPMMDVVHHRIGGGTVDDTMQGRCDEAFAGAMTRLATQLEGREWLVGNQMSAADVAAGATAFRIQKGSMLRWPSGAERIQPWVDRVMSYDSVPIPG